MTEGEYDFVCFVHDFQTLLKALLDREGGILRASYYSKIVYV